MVYVSGKARIQHAETGKVYEIDSREIQFENLGSEERNMGPETHYSAVVEHPQLGELIWSIWEYPTGAENDRELSQGPHILLENIEFGLEHIPLEDEDDIQMQINELVDWFDDHYDDPANHLPYSSDGGGYQWIYGSPCDAKEELEDNFFDTTEGIIESAVDIIESGGTMEWCKKSDLDESLGDGHAYEIVYWFRENYEDSSANLFYDSEEKSYFWEGGGPYDAREVLEDEFPDTPKDTIDEAVEIIEANGIAEWAKIYRQKKEDIGKEQGLSSKSSKEIITQLNLVIENIPDEQVIQAFEFGDDDIVYLKDPSDQKHIENDPLLEELKQTTDDLLESISGTNAFAFLEKILVSYKLSLFKNPLSVSQLYARGVSLANAKKITFDEIKKGDLPELDAAPRTHLTSIIELHKSWIMQDSEGRKLAQSAANYDIPSHQIGEVIQAGRIISEAISKTPELFDKDTSQYFEDITNEIAKGQEPARSNQIAIQSSVNLIGTILKRIRKHGLIPSVIFGHITVEGFTQSTIGKIAIDKVSSTINASWNFLISIKSEIEILSFTLSDASPWLKFIVQVLSRIG